MIQHFISASKESILFLTIPPGSLPFQKVFNFQGFETQDRGNLGYSRIRLGILQCYSFKNDCLAPEFGAKHQVLIRWSIARYRRNASDGRTPAEWCFVFSHVKMHKRVRERDRKKGKKATAIAWQQCLKAAKGHSQQEIHQSDSWVLTKWR